MALNPELSDLFAAMASLMELKGENTFKVIAFQKVSRIIRDLNFDLRKCMEEGKLGEIEGIGKSSKAIIEEYLQTGKSAVFQEMSAEVPSGLVELLQIEGLGPKTTGLLWKQKGITSLPELIKALDDGSLKDLKGIGDKKVAAIRKGIEMRAQATAGGAAALVGILEAQEAADELAARVRAIDGVVDVQIAGSLRRRRETIADIDLVAAVDDPALGQSISDQFTALKGVIHVLGAGPTKASVKIANGMQADLRIIPTRHFGAALLYFTGSKDHNVKMRGIAQKLGMTLNEWGLYKLPADGSAKLEKTTGEAPRQKAVASEDEKSIYTALGMSFVEPELREDRGEIDLSLGHKLPAIITRNDIRGDLHNHTTESDGTASILEMAEEARALGYEYLAVTDHSKALAMTNGLSVERLLKHAENIRKISSTLKGITLLAGSEVDILADGRMDYEDEVLKELDIVIASPHLALKQEERKATDRLLRAIDNRYVNIIGHPTGRLINKREGLKMDMASLFARAAQNGVAMEINAGYPRLDLDEFNARAAVAAGVKLSIDTDAHSTPELSNIGWGLGVARRAWVTAENVINTWPLGKLRTFLSKKR